uniref:Uncharacterized protein n=1 Tax=Trichuris muris TaxID=70415 RepID=A0A5S6PZK4_TRIMR
MKSLTLLLGITTFIWQASVLRCNIIMRKGVTVEDVPSGKREPLRCEDHLGRHACSRRAMRPEFADKCRNSRLLHRYHCCRSCAKYIGIQVTPGGFFRDVGNFTYYDPTCPNIIDRAVYEGREDVFSFLRQDLQYVMWQREIEQKNCFEENHAIGSGRNCLIPTHMSTSYSCKTFLLFFNCINLGVR